MRTLSPIVSSGQPTAYSYPRGSVGPYNPNETRLDRIELDGVVDQLFHNGLAPSTQRVYTTPERGGIVISVFVLACLRLRRRNIKCQFVAILANDKLCHATIKCYLSAVRHLHLENNCLDPKITNIGRLEQVLRGVKYIQARGSKPRTRLPISVDILHRRKPSNPRSVSPTATPTPMLSVGDGTSSLDPIFVVQYAREDLLAAACLHWVVRSGCRAIFQCDRVRDS